MEHLTAEQIEFFDTNGYLVLRNWITGPLLADLQSAGQEWIAGGLAATAAGSDRSDYAFAARAVGEVFFRVDYLHDKGEAASLALLGSPKVLGVAESLAGRNFVPTYESMVFKSEGDGEAIRWHQDAVHPRKTRIFNYDLYLDESRDGAGALVVIPGSQGAPIDACQIEAEHGWSPPGSTVVEMQPGDVLIHDVMVVHGSPRAVGNALRRTIYYEFRAAEQIISDGPWDEDWIARRMRLIPLAQREFARQFPDEPGFEWRPDARFHQALADDADLRVVHVKHTSGSYCSATSPV